MKNSNLKTTITAALLAAMTCIATMIIKLPTPTMGYIHLGDGFVLLCGIILGPGMGGLAAGIGSMLSDLFSGYAAWAPATFLIKALSSCAAGFLFRRLRHTLHSGKGNRMVILPCGIIGETIMVTGYFLYETGLAVFANGDFSAAALAGGIATAATGIPFNIVQGVAGILICALLLPVLQKINPGLLAAASENTD